MYELTNLQRPCFGLAPVEDAWQPRKLPRGRYDEYDTLCYLEGSTIRKVILSGSRIYCEYEVELPLDASGTRLLPQRAGGKACPLSSTRLLGRKPLTMKLSYQGSYISLVNHRSGQTFYSSEQAMPNVACLEDFIAWVDAWCSGTDPRALAQIREFAGRKRQRRGPAPQAGDFFRYRLDRELYGYGQVLLNYGDARSRGIPCWDVIPANSLLVAVCHICTPRPDLTAEQLRELEVLPPQILLDVRFRLGDYVTVDHAPVAPEDYACPMVYGLSRSHDPGSPVFFQWGLSLYQLPAGVELCPEYRQPHVGWDLMANTVILRQCIRAGHNGPYWEANPRCLDLRNPRQRRQSRQIRTQVAKLGVLASGCSPAPCLEGLPPEELPRGRENSIRVLPGPDYRRHSYNDSWEEEE